MELQLGLALPTHDAIEGLELINRGLIRSKQVVGCLELWRTNCSSESKKHVRNKRSFEESFGHSLKPLPLLVWSGQPNEEDDRSGKMHRTIHTSNKNEEEENSLVGWPPIKSWRKKELHRQHPAGGQIRNNNRMQLHRQHPAGGQIRNNNRMQADENHSRGPNSFYVKVNMEGVTIGRKVDLRLYNSYQSLTNTLISMFAKYQKFEEDGASYTLTFQNEQGDWLLAGHVPWQSFVGTVRRLAILRNANETI